MMSIFLTEELENHTARRSDAEMLFFFCGAQDEKRNTGVAVLRGILYQIIAKRPQLITHALPYFRTPERTRQTLSSLETLWIIFTKLVTDTALGIMFCVLDGLDECDESTKRVLLPRIVGLLTDRTSLTMGVFKLVIVSREIHALRGCDCSRIRLDPDNDAKVDSDIELFVSTRVQGLSRIEGFNNDFRSYVQASLLQRAEGTFLWVGFAMYELSQKETCIEILEVLEDLPTGLPAIYDRMLLQIPASHREVSQAILRWVTMAVCPLRLGELATAVGLQPRHPHLNLEQVARDAVTRCGPLLKITEHVIARRDRIFLPEARPEVSLIHQSVRDYLLREERDCNTVLDVFRLQAKPSHLELAQKCLDYLAQSSLQHTTIDMYDGTTHHNFPLLEYAVCQWPEHAKNCSALAEKLIDPHGFFLQKASPLRQHWWKIYRTSWNTVPGNEPLLHIACSVEIIPWIEALLSKKRWIPRHQKRVNEKDGHGDTALHHAASRKNIAIVRLLLNRGADVKAKGIAERTALHYTVRTGNTAFVHLLLDRGADVNARDMFGDTVLHSAVKEGSTAVVQLLLDRGADINAQFKNGYTALHHAAMRGDRAFVQLLLDRGADIEAKDVTGWTPLHCSAAKGEEDVAYLLVNRGADIYAKDNDGNTALLWATLERHEQKVVWSEGMDPTKKKAISDFLRSRMDTAPDARTLRNQYAISNPPSITFSEWRHALSQPPPYK
jgi:ankyrin repeat protein